MSLEQALGHARAGRGQAELDLLEELRIPSVSTLPQHRDDVRRNCDWLAARFRSLGFEVAVTDVVEGGHPVLQADWRGRAGAPTLTIYGHYDVQPPDPLSEWRHPPFEPVVEDGLVHARGGADNKGNHLAALKAAEHALASGGPPLNLRYLLEGEEEIGGESLPRYLRDHASRLASDYTLVWDGGFAPDGRPALVTGLRGMVYLELRARGPAVDLHSGAYGGIAPNPLNSLARVLGELKDREGRITIPGFYDRVREPSAAESADWNRSPEYEATLRSLIGSPALEGEAGHAAADRQWARPTLDVNGVLGGFTGAGSKTVIPARAMAKVSMRLVPDQDAAEVVAAFRDHVARLTTPGVEIEVLVLSTANPAVLGFDHHGARTLRAALGSAFGASAANVRAGGSVPVTLDFQRHVGGQVMCSGLSQPGAGSHSPNERLSLDHFHRGTEALLHLMYGL